MRTASGVSVANSTHSNVSRRSTDHSRHEATRATTSRVKTCAVRREGVWKGGDEEKGELGEAANGAGSTMRKTPSMASMYGCSFSPNSSTVSVKYRATEATVISMTERA